MQILSNYLYYIIINHTPKFKLQVFFFIFFKRKKIENSYHIIVFVFLLLTIVIAIVVVSAVAAVAAVSFVFVGFISPCVELVLALSRIGHSIGVSVSVSVSVPIPVTVVVVIAIVKTFLDWSIIVPRHGGSRLLSQQFIFVNFGMGKI
jgi:hypothetical protein